MINTIRKIAILFAVVLIGYMSYEAFIRDTAREWKNYKEPQLAAYTSLEQDEEILKELDRQTRFSSYKPIQESKYLTKPSIFQKVN